MPTGNGGEEKVRDEKEGMEGRLDVLKDTQAGEESMDGRDEGEGRTSEEAEGREGRKTGQTEDSGDRWLYF